MLNILYMYKESQNEHYDSFWTIKRSNIGGFLKFCKISSDTPFRFVWYIVRPDTYFYIDVQKGATLYLLVIL